jgi:hypothetical protein
MNTSAIQPFQFEPERTVGLNQENNAEDDRPTQELHENEDYQRVEEARVGQNRWCLCGNCFPMPSENGSVCCKELHFLSAAVQGRLSIDQTIVLSV